MESHIISRSFEEQDVRFLFSLDSDEVRHPIRIPGDPGSGQQGPSPHTHSSFELFYVAEGRIRIWSEAQEYLCEKDTLILIPPGVWHYSTASENNTVYDFFFELSRQKTAGELFPSLSPLTSLQNVCLQTPANGLQWRKILNRISCAVQDRSPLGNLRMKGAFLTLLTDLLDLLSKNGEEKDASGKEEPGASTGLRIDYLISSQYSNGITLKEIAEYLNFSTKQINRISVKRTGKTIAERLQDTRMRAAVKLLDTTELSVERIAYRIGYRSQKGFLYTFHRTFGETPYQYRKKKNRPSAE